MPADGEQQTVDHRSDVPAPS
eukprot:COSAG02_NODE_37582_length_440_cov_0.780059_1_plen_20_part_01